MKLAIIILCVLYPCSASWLLLPCNDTPKLDEVQVLVDQFHFKYKYENDTFDCVDMSVANYRFLKGRGYAPLIAIRPTDDRTNRHCFVIFPLGDGWAALDTAESKLMGRSLNDSLGQISSGPEVWAALATPEDVFAIDPRGPPKITGEVVVANSILPLIFS
jgi:hypothetical protein